MHGDVWFYKSCAIVSHISAAGLKYISDLLSAHHYVFSNLRSTCSLQLTRLKWKGDCAFSALKQSAILHKDCTFIHWF